MFKEGLVSGALIDDARVANDIEKERETIMKLTTLCRKGLIGCTAIIGFLQPASLAVADTSIPDETLQSQVERRLRMEGDIDWRELKVEANEGRVTLYGVVGSKAERGKATDVASTVENIKEVVNRILVVPGTSDTRQAAEAHINSETRDRVIEGPAALKDRQILP